MNATCSARRFLPALALGLPIALAPVAAGDDAGNEAPATPTYHRDIAPILRSHCLGCHDSETAKGRLDLTGLETLLTGGKQGPPVVPGAPDESLLLQLVSGQRKPYMPPRRQRPLGEGEVATLRRWIEARCPAGDAARDAAPYTRPPPLPRYGKIPAITALEYSRDGSRLYVSGFREILVHRVPRSASERPSYPEARLVGEAEQIHSLSLSPDGRWLAAAGGNPARFGEVQLWSTEGHSLEGFLRLGQDTLFSVAFSASGDRIVVAGADRSIRLIDVKSREVVRTLEPHADWVFAATFSADGQRIVSASRDRSIKVSLAADGTFLANLARFDEPSLRLLRRPGSNEVLVVGASEAPLLFDLGSLEETGKLERQPGAVLGGAFDSTGECLALAGAYGEARVYRMDDGARLATCRLPGEWIYAVALRPGGRELALGGFSGCVYIRSVPGARAIADFVPFPRGRFRSF